MTTITPTPSETLAESYDRLGVVQLRGVLTPEEVREIRDVFMEQVERDASVAHDDGVGADDVLARYPRLVHPHRRRDLPVGRLARQWMLDPRITGPVTEVVGAVHAAQSMFYFKPPTARGQAMHQDNLFLQAYPETCVAAWIAIDDVDGENGGLKMVPGSHRFELQCTEPADPEESFTRDGLNLPGDMDVVQTEMGAGDVLIFHGSMVHGSGPNRSAGRFRRSLIFHYVPTESTEIAAFYHPLTALDGSEVEVEESSAGGACGEGWLPEGPH